jgi:lambda family phage portal protein
MGFFRNVMQSILPKGNALMGGGRAYDAGRWDTREMAGWNPSLNTPNNEVLDSRDKVTARARDMARNHPIVAGAIDRRAEAVVGANIRVEAQPAFELMGRTSDWADEWATTVEGHFSLWANDSRFLADAQMTQSFGGLVETAYRHWWIDGEALVVRKMLAARGPRVGARYQTCFQLIDPDRLSNPNGMADNTVLQNGNRVIGGVEINPDSAPVAYWIRVAHPAETGMLNSFRWERVRRFGPSGAPIAIHAFKTKRADQRRGISQFVAAIKRVKMFDRYDDAEIEAALLNSVMAASVTSKSPTAEVMEAMAPVDENEAGWSTKDYLNERMKHPVKVEGVRTIHLLPDEEFELHRAEHPSQNYPEFQATGLRTMSANFGLSYAQVAQNWADINYSSARAMLNEIWRGLLHDRWQFTQALCTPMYSAWLEEAVAIAKVKVPGGPANFYRWRPELTQCEWMGPGRGTVDPLKEANANEIALNAGTTNLSLIADESGRDHRKVLQGQARDKRLREKLGLDPFVPLKAGAAAAGGEDDGSDGRDGTGKFAQKPDKPKNREQTDEEDQ